MPTQTREGIYFTESIISNANHIQNHTLTATPRYLDLPDVVKTTHKSHYHIVSFIKAILLSVKWYFIMVLMCITLANVGKLFVCLLAFCTFLEK